MNLKYFTYIINFDIDELKKYESILFINDRIKNFKFYLLSHSFYNPNKRNV